MQSWMYRTWHSGAALWLIASCASIENPAVSDPALALSEPVFRCNVEPILIRQCSYTACHGVAGAALRVYSPGKLRAAPAANIDDQIAELSDAEHHANFESAAGFSFGVIRVDDNFLLRKPLASSAGGYEHTGGAIFSNAGDAQYQTLRTWLIGQGACR